MLRDALQNQCPGQTDNVGQTLWGGCVTQSTDPSTGNCAYVRVRLTCDVKSPCLDPSIYPIEPVIASSALVTRSWRYTVDGDYATALATSQDVRAFTSAAQDAICSAMSSKLLSAINVRALWAL